jgi:hypothetical protein
MADAVITPSGPNQWAIYEKPGAKPIGVLVMQPITPLSCIRWMRTFWKAFSDLTLPARGHTCNCSSNWW